MCRSGAETWSARMKRMFGFLTWADPGVEAMEEGPERGGV